MSRATAWRTAGARGREGGVVGGEGAERSDAWRHLDGHVGPIGFLHVPRPVARGVVAGALGTGVGPVVDNIERIPEADQSGGPPCAAARDADDPHLPSEEGGERVAMGHAGWDEGVETGRRHTQGRG